MAFLHAICEWALTSSLLTSDVAETRGGLTGKERVKLLWNVRADSRGRRKGWFLGTIEKEEAPEHYPLPSSFLTALSLCHWLSSSAFSTLVEQQTVAPFYARVAHLLRGKSKVISCKSTCMSVFVLGDTFYSYTTPDWLFFLSVLKPSSKHFPLPVQRWISLQECTSTDSHFLLDMTALPLLHQLI